MVFKTFYQETDSVFEISSILALVASSAFSFTKCLNPVRICLVLYSFSSLPSNLGNSPNAFLFCFYLSKVASCTLFIFSKANNKVWFFCRLRIAHQSMAFQQELLILTPYFLLVYN
jgi:ABC-type uncharacterized transport system permease subunit